MDNLPTPPLSDEEIHAFVDAQLTPAECAGVQARLLHDLPAQSAVRAWQQQRAALQALHQAVSEAPLPALLRQAVQQIADRQQALDHWWRWGGKAASVFLAFGVGWIANSVWNGGLKTGGASPALARSAAAQDFARQASVAHVVFSPEVRHPVEVAAADQEHLVKWLSKRLGKSLKVPNLAPQGSELMGGRLLPGEAGARAQFMFQSAAGTRITLYLGTVDKAPVGTDKRETGFHFSAEGPTPSFYWVDQGFGYALAGPMPRAELMKLAEAVYSQL